MIDNKENELSVAPEYGVDSRYQSDEERVSESSSLMEYRSKRKKQLPKEQIIRAKLMQLKFKMEDYLKQPVYDKQNHFSEFLQYYIDTIYSKRNEFANDVDISPVKLSQILNNHREPQDEFILKLMIHSEKVFKNVCEFQEKTWYEVYFHEKICDMMSNQSDWRPKIEKHVRFNEPVLR